MKKWPRRWNLFSREWSTTELTMENVLLHAHLHGKVSNWNLPTFFPLFEAWLLLWVTATKSEKGQPTNKYYGGDVSVSSSWCYNFLNQFIWSLHLFVWICIACFLYYMFYTFFCSVAWIKKDVWTKQKKNTISSK